MSEIALICEDLFFSSRIREAAERAGHQVTLIDSVEDWDAARAGPWDLVLVEAMSEGLPWPRWIAELKAGSAPPVVAFGGHANTALRDRALAAGADAFVPNARIASDLAGLIREYAGERSA